MLDCKIIGEPRLAKLHGYVFANQEYNCWIGCSYHPASSFYTKGPRKDKTAVIAKDMREMLRYLDKPLPAPLTTEGNHLIEDSTDAVELLELMSKSRTPVAFDYETTCLSAYGEGAKILTVGLSIDPKEGYCVHLANPKWSIVEQAYVYNALKRFVMSDAPKVVQNYNMEELWSREHVGASINNLKMDTMVATHVVNCRRGSTSLDFQVYRMTGHHYSDMVDKKHMADVPITKMSNYNCWDGRYTIMLAEELRDILVNEKNSDLLRFNSFLHSYLPALANLKERGMNVDREKVDEFVGGCEASIEDFKVQLAATPAGTKYRKKFGEDVNVDSHKQLAGLFYGIYEIKPGKKVSVDAPTLERFYRVTRNREVKESIGIILEYKKKISLLKRVREYRGVTGPDGKIHPSYNLNIAETYRSSTDGPNVQNMFKRDPELIKFRKIIIPLGGNLFLEVDHDGMEVRTIAMVSGDRALTQQIKDGIDTHTLWATKLFQKPAQDIDSDERFESKNSFVFASFYGAEFKSIAGNMGLPEGLVEAVQKEFWELYAGVKEWQERVLAEYEKNQYVSCVTGFRRPGPLSDEQLYNTPIQGPAFHLVLDGLARVDKALVEDGFKTYIITETHDSLLFDVYPDEVEDVIELSSTILCSKRFEWQGDVPLSVSWEMGENYYEMEKI
jgi:DNA polymerase-1